MHTLHTPLTLGYLTLLFLPLQFQSLFPNPLFFFLGAHKLLLSYVLPFIGGVLLFFLFLGVLLLLFSLSREDHRHYLVWLSPQCTAYNSTKSVNKKSLTSHTEGSQQSCPVLFEKENIIA